MRNEHTPGVSWSDLDPVLLKVGRKVQDALREGSVLMAGPLGGGKTMIARRLGRGLGVDDPVAAAREQSFIYRLAGSKVPLPLSPPFRAPHYTVGLCGMVGRVEDWRPGELSLAHGGVLFLDDVVEFQSGVLDAVEKAYTEKRVVWRGWSVSSMLRVEGAVAGEGGGPAAIGLGADFKLVGAMSCCPCGRRGYPAGHVYGKPCECSVDAVKRYKARVEGRFDTVISVPMVPMEQPDA